MVAPAILAAIITQAASMANQAMQKQPPLGVDLPNQGGGINMKPTIDTMAYKQGAGGPADAGMPGLDQAILDTPSPGSKINEAIATADKMNKLETPNITDPVPLDAEGKSGFFGDMSKADKLAFAASVGSLLRGPGPPSPPSASAGGQGINMAPVFLRDLYRGR